MEHFNQDFIGWFTYPRLYSDMVAALPDGARFVEVGVYEGKSLAYYLVEMINANKSHEVFAVDSFTFDGLLLKFRENMEPVQGFYHEIISVSWDAPAKFKDKSLDFVFLDADHVYESISKDIDAWLPKVKPGGILAGHDYCPDHTGVIEAVCERFGKKNICFDYIDELCWLLKIK